MTTTAITTTRQLLTAADTDIVKFFSFFTDDCVFRLGNNDPVTGRDAIQQWVGEYLGSVSGMKHDILEEWSEGPVAALRVEVTYTLHNGDTFTLPAVTRTTIRDSRVSEYLIFMDPSPVAAGS
ncbi:hypothetical protein GTC6_09924 [Gordonia terrae C-6]|uniref:SnoaL-like domain-containing protein n=1 Tax=Gordonia terrae C-6 TaxID=1316928 RepID=R7YAD4_9ACTN|nr:nuclear transport factor 2 family protein [Gordonia terrae]EON32973.1 hypothetical protein GTC6_09924 [Gordonia terrae C-6]